MKRSCVATGRLKRQRDCVRLFIVIARTSNHYKRTLSRHVPPAAWIGPATMVHSRHTTKVFDSDLQELARAIAEMGGLAERQIAEAIEALTTRDSGPARRIVAADATIDAMQRNIEKRAIETIARRQPVAGDLREIVGILRIANEIERIGDLAKNIGKRIIAINGNGEDVSRKSMRGVCQMAAHAGSVAGCP